MRQLILLRHAKSDWYSAGATDFERPLAERGKRDAPKMGRWLKEQKIAPDFIASSPAKRTRETIIAICEELNESVDRIYWDPRLYLADVTTLVEVLKQCPATKNTVLIVGHNPGLEDVLAYLVGQPVDLPADGKLLPTATLAQLSITKEWHELMPGCAKITAIIRPRSLSESLQSQ